MGNDFNTFVSSLMRLKNENLNKVQRKKRGDNEEEGNVNDRGKISVSRAKALIRAYANVIRTYNENNI